MKLPLIVVALGLFALTSACNSESKTEEKSSTEKSSVENTGQDANLETVVLRVDGMS